MRSQPNLNSLLRERRVVVCAGAGGVGKTTTAAALSVAAARMGRRVASLTVDPARRLADSLGLKLEAGNGATHGEAQELDPALWDCQPSRGGRLSVVLLDTKRTFDDLIARLAPDAATRERIYSNPLYQQVSTRLAGAHEYMAVEKLLSVRQDPRFDFVVLDTPPAQNAMDFLTAPARLISALDGKVVHWLSAAFDQKRGLSLGLLARGVSRVLSVMGRITGQDLLEQMARFVVDLDSVFGGFRSRAEQVAQCLRSPDLAFVLVANATPSSLDQVRRLGQHLVSQHMPVGGVVVNRVRPTHADLTQEQCLSELSRRAADRPPPPVPLSELVPILLSAQQDYQRQARAHDEILSTLALELSSLASADPKLVVVPELRQDPATLRGLDTVASLLAGEPPPNTQAPPRA